MTLFAVAAAVTGAVIASPSPAPAAPHSASTWQSYVLAPTTHQLRPVSVLSTDARSGMLQGSPSAVLGDGTGASVRIMSSGDRTQSPLLTVDFGSEVGGNVSLHVMGASTPRPDLHLCFSESLSEMAIRGGDNDGEGSYAPGCDTANIWSGYPTLPYNYDADSHVLPLGTAALPATVTDPVLRGGFRYLTIFLDGPGWVDVNGSLLSYTAAPKQANPSAYQGWFLSSDNQLNKIWYAGAYTVQMNTAMPNTAKSWPYAFGQPDQASSLVPNADPATEVIFDGAKRDRNVWQGDLSVQAQVTYLSTNDVAAVNNSLSSLAAQQQSDGFMPAESLIGQHNLDEMRFYGEYVTWFVDNMYQHWLYTGDNGYLNRYWSALTRAVGWLESVRAQDSGGLLAFGQVGSCGHYAYVDCGHETYVNALYVRNLNEMADLAGAVGADGSGYSTKAQAVAYAINTYLWDSNNGAYKLSEETPNLFPQDANAAAVETGVASKNQASRALSYLRSHNWSTYGSLSVPPGSPSTPIPLEYEPLPSGMEADARLSQPDNASQQLGLQLIRTYWGYQLSHDPGSTFWEKMTAQGDPGVGQFTSLAHGWASGPTVSLTNHVLGVTPTGPGFSGYSVVPHPADLSWAQGVVPTPLGPITVSWQHRGSDFQLTVDGPANSLGELAVPATGSKPTVKLDGQTVASAHVAGDGYVHVSGIRSGHHVLEARG
jgi:hypothetical protein